MRQLINKKLPLKELPEGYSTSHFGTSNLTVGKRYKILDYEGNNLWFRDNIGKLTSCSYRRFIISEGKQTK
jgi:hypothetical protein